ncbi:MAG: hypothetical protein H7835_02780 [Magnetococcus sp. XQGC-1]
MVAWLEAVGTSGGVKMLVVAADNGGVKMLVGYQLPSFTSAGSVWYDEGLLGGVNVPFVHPVAVCVSVMLSKKAEVVGLAVHHPGSETCQRA